MEIKAAIFDIDGTLLPHELDVPSAKTMKALADLRTAGVVVIIATGRALFNAKTALGGIKADYYVCANGAWTANAAEKTIAQTCFSTEEMYALVDFFEDDNLPLSFIFNDGYYAYVEHVRFVEMYAALEEAAPFLHDGENQMRHQKGMPFAATGILDDDKAQRFTAKYGYLNLRFVPFGRNRYDILRGDCHKAVAVDAVLQKLGIDWQNTAAFGDGANDAELLAAAGFSVAMQNGAESLQKTASVVAPPALEDGVAQIVEQYIL
ncbi:MAG: HAD family hydrolase [Ruthenibacterium sp.]